jgi:hypothetical protein
MACTALFTPMAMATTQVARVIRYQSAEPWISEKTTERQPLRMNWVVVTDKDGKRRLCAEWLPTDGS